MARHLMLIYLACSFKSLMHAAASYYRGIKAKKRKSKMPYVKIAQIKAGMRGITVTGKATRKGDKKEVETRFGPATVSWVFLEDETGSIRLNLWRQQID